MEEEVVINDEKLLYTLSNSLEDIEIAIYSRTGQNINLKNVSWKIDPVFKPAVKQVMLKHQVKYSMTIRNFTNSKELVVNMHVNDEWFVTGFTEIENSYQSWEIIQVMKTVDKLLKEQSLKKPGKKPGSNLRNRKNLTIANFIEALDSLFEKRLNNEVSSEILAANLLSLVKNYRHLEVCSKIIDYDFKQDDFFLFMCMCHLFINKNNNKIGFTDLRKFYDNRIIVHEIINTFSKGEHILLKNGYIEYNEENDCNNPETWRLSDRTKFELFLIKSQESVTVNGKNDI